MSSTQQPSIVGQVLTVILSLIAGLLWLITLSLLGEMTGSDAAGNAMAQGFAALALVVLWLLLAIMGLIAFLKGAMPRWAAAAMLVLIPASGVASAVALELLTRRGLAPYSWPMLVPALTPPLIIAFCYWAVLPSLRAWLSAPIMGGAVWGMVLALCLAILPMQQMRGRVLAEREAARVRFDAMIDAVPADAPLAALVALLDGGDYVQKDRMLERIRKLDRRQADAEEMLARGDFPLRYLSQFNLKPTLSLCTSARGALRERAAALTLPAQDAKPFSAIADEADGAANALRWLIDYDCPAMPEAEAWETMAKAYRDPSYTIYELRDLRDPKRLGRALDDPEEFSLLTPRAPLKAWLKFAGDSDLRDKVIAGARTLPHRTADAVGMFKSDDVTTRFLLENMPRLDLEPTPALCQAGLRYLHAQLAGVYVPGPEDKSFTYLDLEGRLGRGGHFPALIWLASHGCDAQAELAEAIGLIKAYRPTPEGGLMQGLLEALQRKP